jgi:hypothetical protein
VLGVGETFGQVDAAMQLRRQVTLGLPSHLDLVDLFDAVAGMGEPVCQLTVIRDQD